MHPLNRLLSIFGAQISKIPRLPEKYIEEYNRNFTELKKNCNGFNIIKDRLWHDIGDHPASHIDYECGFAASHLYRLDPKRILDIGSYRHFIIGMLTHFQVTTVDVRKRKPISGNETILSCDAKKLDLPDNEFDTVIALCALSHFGLTRYGDRFDPDADKKAIKEMIRVLKPNGNLIFTAPITKSKPTLVFNAHRIYSYEMLRSYCADLICSEEKFYSRKLDDFCALEEITAEPSSAAWDIYLGCWKKR